MATMPTYVPVHRKRMKFSRRKLLEKIGVLASSLFSLAVVMLVFSAAWLYSNLTRDLPSLETLPVLLNPPEGILLQPTRLYDSSGEHIIRTLNSASSSERQYLGLAPELWNDHDWQVSSVNRPEVEVFLTAELVDAILATTEPTFWSSPGFSMAGLLDNTSPTLAQRLVRDLLLADEPDGIRRNLRERLLAAQLTATYGRGKVLEWYLNSAQFGPLVYGASDAAQVYLGKPADKLNLAEAALLAAAAAAPGLNPLDATEITLQKQQETLLAMHEAGFINQNQLAQAQAATINLRPPEPVEEDLFFPFTELVLEELYKRLGAERLERGGLKVWTTLDYDLQIQVSCAASMQVMRMEESAPDDTAPPKTDCQAARLLPTLAMESKAGQGSLSAQVVVLDVRSGYVLALGGDGQANQTHLHQSAYEPGSLMTPFIYLTSFTRGMGPASLVWDIPLQSTDGQALDASQIYYGPVSLRTAFANDYLIPAAQILGQIGPESVWRISREFGLSSLDILDINGMMEKPLLSGGQTSLLEIGQAYGVFANQGVLAGQTIPTPASGNNGMAPIQPITVLLVEDIEGKAWLSCGDQPLNCNPQVRPIVSPQLAYLVTDMLSDETARWPTLGHPNALEIGRPAGAKIGQIGTESQAWTAGFTPQIASVVWLGGTSSTQQTLPSEMTAKGAAGLWHAVIQYASRDLTPESWSIPTGISRREVCYPSGLLPTVNCPTVVLESFIDGNEPNSPDNLYRVFQINRESGRLATIFTPSELVEERVYLVVPPNAVEWAQIAGLPTPPDAYDAISAPKPLADVQITSPGMFSHISGEVAIKGSAAGPDFEFYRLQVGQGLNPREWIQIGETNHKTVRNGNLAEWNLNGLSGLYAVQLQVVRADQRIETAIIQVTVDNQEPQVSITQPVQGQRFITDQQKTIILQVEANDGIALQKVEFYIDERLLASLSQAPFTLSWSPTPGQHTFRARAYDLAQNTSEDSLNFSVTN
ncbi:MAG: transglycosylase domain-containing protein [Anaerolineales bacterium]